MKQSARSTKAKGLLPANPEGRVGAAKVIPFPETACSFCPHHHKTAGLMDPAGGMTITHELPSYAGLSYLPKALQNWRAGHDLKISAAAKGLGVAASTWGHWETGVRFPTGSILLDLVAYTGLTLVELVCEHGQHCPLHHLSKSGSSLPPPGSSN